MVFPATNLGIAFTSAHFSRPNNTNVYASGDVVTISTVTGVTIDFLNAVSDIGGSGRIRSAMMVDDANQVVKGGFELWLFHTAPVVDADNARWTPTDAELLNLIAIIPLATPYVGDNGVGPLGNCVYYSPSLSMPIFCGPSTTIYGVLVMRLAQGNYTPVANERFDITLAIQQG